MQKWVPKANIYLDAKLLNYICIFFLIHQVIRIYFFALKPTIVFSFIPLHDKLIYTNYIQLVLA